MTTARWSRSLGPASRSARCESNARRPAANICSACLPRCGPRMKPSRGRSGWCRDWKLRRNEMGERMSIYAGEPVQRALASLGRTYEENRSGRLNTVCERYLAMVDDELARLDLSESEWCAIMEANNDVEIGVESHSSHVLLWANVHDCRGLS